MQPLLSKSQQKQLDINDFIRIFGTPSPLGKVNMILLDPSVLPSLANEKAEENKFFKIELKKYKNEFLDPLVKTIQDEIESQIDCTQCANCCKKLEAGITHEEINKLAVLKNCTPAQFQNDYTSEEESTKIIYLKNTPCSFLSENKCSIYADKPNACSTYPSLSGANFKYRLRVVFTNYSICPIVYNSIEKLKSTLNFQVNNQE